jgi:hypothetical protein
MSPRAKRGDSSGPEVLEELFTMGRRKPTVAILLLLGILAAVGIVAGAVVNETGDIPAHIPSRNSDERLGAGGGGFDPSAFDALPQPVEPTIPPSDAPLGENVITLGPGRAVTIEIPEGWEVVSRDDAGAFAFFRGPGGTTFGAELVNVDAASPASDLLLTAIDDVLATERYTQRRLSAVQTRVPFGRLISWAVTGYSAIRTDPQGAQSVGGNLSVYVREDGLGLIVNAEVTPVGDWDEGIEDWEPMLLEAVESFAGQQFP